MRNTEEWMERVFSDPSEAYYRQSQIAAEDRKRAHFMIVPTSGDKVEIPVFIVDQYDEMLKQKAWDNISDCISVPLKYNGYKSNYESFDRIIRSSLSDSFAARGLVKLQGKDGSDIHTYFATSAALFSSNLKPLMMCTWQMEKRDTVPSQRIYSTQKVKSFFVKPILRIDPEFFLAKPDNVGRFVNKKMVSMVLPKVVYTPRSYSYDYIGALYNHAYIPTLMVEKIPFEIRTVPAPSVSTTRETLLNLALENLEDME